MRIMRKTEIRKIVKAYKKLDTRETILRIAAAALVDPRTVHRFLEGDSLRATSEIAIHQAIRELKLLPMKKPTVKR
jgi:hypothetical protein